MMTMTIKNREEIIEKLAEMLKQFDREHDSFQTDVYMYIDEDGTATLETFVNVGGSSWSREEHYTIYSDKEHNESIMDTWEAIGELADALGVEHDTLVTEAAKHYDIDAEDVSRYEVSGYIEEHEELFEKLEEAYSDYLDELTSEYVERAEEIISEWENGQDEQDEEW